MSNKFDAFDVAKSVSLPKGFSETSTLVYETRYQFEENLKKLGYRELGSGCFGVVYGSKQSNVVVKVCNTFSNIPYLSWVKHCIKARGTNKNMPIILSLKFYKTSGEGEADFFVVTMEKLEKFDTSNQKDRDLYQKMENAVYGDKVRLVGNSDNPSDHMRDATNRIKRAKKDARKSFEARQKFFKGVVLPYSSEMEREDACVDMHCGNVMYRDNTLVITDPLS